MSKHKAQARFHYWRAPRHRKVETRRLWALPLRAARTNEHLWQRPNQDPAPAPKQDLYFGTGR